MTEPLFDLTPTSPVPVESLSANRRRTLRQHDGIARGIHPLAHAVTGVRLHPQACQDPDDKTTGPRCGGCRWRSTATAWPKCLRDGHHRVTGSVATDVRAWWPACTDWESSDPAGVR